MKLRPNSFRKAAALSSWGLYDVANQFFAINIVSLYFVLWVTVEKNTPEKYYSLFYALSLLMVALTAPVLGEISDKSGQRKVFLAVFTAISVLCTAFLEGFGNVFLALILFALANFGCQAAIIFYNAMITSVAPENKVSLVSGFGKMMGYSGAVIALFLAKPLVEAGGPKAVFVPTAFFFLVLSLPCFLFVKERTERVSGGIKQHIKPGKIKGSFRVLKDVLTGKTNIPGIEDLMKAGFFGLCAVQVVIVFMGVYARRALGLGESEIADLIIFSTLFAMMGSMLSGYIGHRAGLLKSFMAAIALWCISLTVGAFLTYEKAYGAIGALIGISLGSTWVLSRALIAKVVPDNRLAEMFAVFHIMGYMAGAVGVLYWGIIVWMLAPFEETGYRAALFSLNIFLAVSMFYLFRLRKRLKSLQVNISY